MRPVDARLERLLGDGAAAFCATFDLVSDPVGVLWAVRDERGEVVDFETGYPNPAMDRMIGVPIEHSFGRAAARGVSDVRAGRGLSAHARRGGDLTGRPEVVEMAVDSGEGPIGRVRGVFVHRALPFGPDSVLNLVTDVTEQRQLQSELEQYAKVAAHDLREPLTTIALFIEQLSRRLDRGRDAPNERLLELLRHTHKRATTLVDGILEYARSGGTPDAQDVDMGSVVREVLDSFTAALHDADAEVRITELPTVHGSRQQLGRVVQNLIANSLKFRSSMPPRVTVSAERVAGFWLFSVRDNGIGLPAGLGDEIFAMFKRAHGEQYGGCGIGLAVCRKIVEAHGGQIWAEPAEGAGAVVHFTIPAIETHAAPPRAKQHSRTTVAE
jgi:signal transduction histidine kinase